MKCPYNRGRETHTMGWAQSQSGEPRSCGMQVDMWSFEMADCLKEDCGAWRYGHCCYAAVSLNNE